MLSPSFYRIVSSQGGRWMIITDDNQSVRGDQDYPSVQVAEDALAEMLKGKGLVMTVETGPGGRIYRGVKPSIRRPDADLSFTVSGEFDDFLNQLSEEVGEDRLQVIRLGLGLLRLGLDAKSEGNRLAIVTPDGKVAHEIVDL